MKIHFIGIGGTGISALAQYYLTKGEQVSGSDLVSSSFTNMLQEKGAVIAIGPNKAENIKDYDLVVYSPAVRKDNPELAEAEKRGIRTLTYPQALGELTKKHFTIAISGTHGKSTTTSMIALIMVAAGLDPTVVVGTKLKEFQGSNFRIGASDYLVIEACEHEESFLNYWPKVAVITNIEADHLDYYGTLDNIKKAFDKFASHLGSEGTLVKRRDVSTGADCPVIEFSLEDKKDVEEIRKIIKLPGEHNILDALAALKVARLLGISDEISLSALSKYQGAWRRFEETPLPGFILIDDYGHHPTEIQATLKGAREKYPDKKICCVFQPHQYQRTYLLFNDFVNAFKEALDQNIIDQLFLIDIYDVAGRESAEAKAQVSSQKLAEACGGTYVAKEELFSRLPATGVVLFMGAGDIYDLSQELKRKYGVCS